MIVDDGGAALKGLEGGPEGYDITAIREIYKGFAILDAFPVSLHPHSNHHKPLTMFSKALFAAATLLSATVASPIIHEKRALATYVEEVTIHSSCNTTQRRQLTKALSDTWELVAMAKEYTYTNGANDSLYELYFGDGPITNVIGAFDAILKSNKDGVLLRCDDPDKNCQQPGWRGHWRGENGTAETVSGA